MKRALFLLILGTCAHAVDHLIDPGDQHYQWNDVEHTRIRIEGIARFKDRPSPFTVDIELETAEGNLYLKQFNLQRNEALGWSPGTLTYIKSVTVAIDGVSFVLKHEKLLNLCNPEPTSVAVHSFDDQLLIAFSGPHGAESYECQVFISRRGFEKLVAQEWVGGKGFMIPRVESFEKDGK